MAGGPPASPLLPLAAARAALLAKVALDLRRAEWGAVPVAGRRHGGRRHAFAYLDAHFLLNPLARFPGRARCRRGQFECLEELL